MDSPEVALAKIQDECKSAAKSSIAIGLTFIIIRTYIRIVFFRLVKMGSIFFSLDLLILSIRFIIGILR